MAIVPKLVLDHVTVQFSYGGEHQKYTLGEVEGAHFTEIEYLYDDEAGKVVGKTNNPMNGSAQKIDPSKVSDLLGKNFATFAAQLSAAEAEVSASKNKVTELEATLAEMQKALDVSQQRNSELVSRLNAGLAALSQ